MRDRVAKRELGRCALDILREKILSRCLDMKCRVNFRRLTGGEFGKVKKKQTSDWFSIPIDSGLIFPFAGSVLVYGREQLLL